MYSTEKKKFYKIQKQKQDNRTHRYCTQLTRTGQSLGSRAKNPAFRLYMPQYKHATRLFACLLILIFFHFISFEVYTKC